MARNTVRIFDGAAAATGIWVKTGGTISTIQATLQGSMTAATVVIEVTIDGIGAITAGTITLSGADVTGFIRFDEMAIWDQVRARVTSVTGTGTVVVTVRSQG